MGFRDGRMVWVEVGVSTCFLYLFIGILTDHLIDVFGLCSHGWIVNECMEDVGGI